MTLLDPKSAASVIGVPLEHAQVAAHLEAMRFGVEKEKGNDGKLAVAVPAWAFVGTADLGTNDPLDPLAPYHQTGVRTLSADTLYTLHGLYYVTTGAVINIPHGTVLQGTFGSTLVIQPGGQIFATAGRCTHLRARMGKGTVKGTLLECPWHGALYDVTDGCVAKWVQHPTWLKMLYDATLPAALKRNLATYDVKEENGEVFVAVD